MPARKVRRFLSPKRNVDVMRIYYCYQLGSTFVTLGLMETRIVTAMMTCDRIKLSKVIQDDVPFWDSIAMRHAQLQSSTLGNLLTILSKHNIAEADLAYLRWVVARAQFFHSPVFRDGGMAGRSFGARRARDEPSVTLSRADFSAGGEPNLSKSSSGPGSWS